MRRSVPNSTPGRPSVSIEGLDRIAEQLVELLGVLEHREVADAVKDHGVEVGVLPGPRPGGARN